MSILQIAINHIQACIYNHRSPLHIAELLEIKGNINLQSVNVQTGGTFASNFSRLVVDTALNAIRQPVPPVPTVIPPVPFMPVRVLTLLIRHAHMYNCIGHCVDFARRAIDTNDSSHA
jgi:hypothetical protein